MSVFAEMVQRHEYRFLQVEVEGEKGLVCGGEIHATVGQVMCREMEKSFFYYSQAAKSRTFKGPRFVSTMECDGDELSTSQCSMSFVRRDSCNGTEITIYCTHRKPLHVNTCLYMHLRTKCNMYMFVCVYACTCFYTQIHV